jgi:hypothetical protein
VLESYDCVEPYLHSTYLPIFLGDQKKTAIPLNIAVLWDVMASNVVAYRCLGLKCCLHIQYYPFCLEDGHQHITQKRIHQTGLWSLSRKEFWVESELVKSTDSDLDLDTIT